MDSGSNAVLHGRDDERGVDALLCRVACRTSSRVSPRLITYTLKEEPGTSLKAAGWKVVRETRDGSWSRNGRPRIDKHPTGQKLLWEAP
jgi:hypothetical protein